MNNKQLYQANIANLTHLWQVTSPVAEAPVADSLQGCASWPHRFWFDMNAPLPDASRLAELIEQLPAQAMMPVWPEWQHAGTACQQLTQALERQGLTPILEQTLMSLATDALPAAGSIETASALEIAPTTDSAAWARVCGEAFGYAIDPAVISRLHGRRDTRLLEARWQGQLAGTALLHKTGSIVGIHQVGVAPGYQRLGIARALMHYSLQQGKYWQADYLTLQASQAGLPLYKQLGFASQGLLISYRRS